MPHNDDEHKTKRDETRADHNWLICRIDPPRQEGGKPVKIPVNERGLNAAFTDAARYTSEEAEARRQQLSGEGGEYMLGYLARPGSTYVGVDLDDVLEDGRITDPELDGILKGLNVLLTPSGKGLRVILPRREGDFWFREKDGIGFYGAPSRFFTVPDTPVLRYTGTEVVDSDELRAWIESRLPRPGSSPPGFDKREVNPHSWLARLEESDLRVCVEEMLGCLGDDWGVERDQWARIGFALRALEEDAGVDLFEAFQTWSERFGNRADTDRESNLKQWEGFRPDAGGRKGIGPGSLIRWARNAGWKSGKWRTRLYRLEAMRQREAEAARIAAAEAASALEQDEPEQPDPEPTLDPLPEGSWLAGIVEDVAAGLTRTHLPTACEAATVAAICTAAAPRFIVVDPVSGRLTRPNVALILAHPSGSGKTHLADVVKLGADANASTSPDDREHAVEAQPASAPGLRRRLGNMKPGSSMLIHVDEMWAMLRAMTSEHAGQHERGLLATILEALPLGAGRLEGRSYANTKENVPPALFPCLGFVGATTPTRFLESLNDELFASGLIGRTLIVVERGVPQGDEDGMDRLDTLRNALSALARSGTERFHGARPGARLPVLPDGAIVSRELNGTRLSWRRIDLSLEARTFGRRRERELVEGAGDDETIRAPYARSMELAIKLSAGYALAEFIEVATLMDDDPMQELRSAIPRIEVRHMERAFAMIEMVLTQLVIRVRKAEQEIGEPRVVRAAKKLDRLIEKARKRDFSDGERRDYGGRVIDAGLITPKMIRATLRRDLEFIREQVVETAVETNVLTPVEDPFKDGRVKLAYRPRRRRT